MHTETTDTILSKQRITKALIRLRGCAYAKNRFSRDVAPMTGCLSLVFEVKNNCTENRIVLRYSILDRMTILTNCRNCLAQSCKSVIQLNIPCIITH